MVIQHILLLVILRTLPQQRDRFAFCRRHPATQADDSGGVHFFEGDRKSLQLAIRPRVSLAVCRWHLPVTEFGPQKMSLTFTLEATISVFRNDEWNETITAYFVLDKVGRNRGRMTVQRNLDNHLLLNLR